VGQPREPEPAKFFVSLLTSEEALLDAAMEALSLCFGRIDWVSGRLPFDFTDYYKAEMGMGLFRKFAAFEPLLPVSFLPDVKQAANGMEARFARQDGRRRINLDPGYLCPEHVILATTKGYSHRPYLREGIYADLTLVYRGGSFQPLEWTYPDYRQESVLFLFNQLRKGCLRQRKEKRAQKP
jgi:hypothetical protein